MMLFDPVTGLPVEALFMDRLGQALAFARRKQIQIAVIRLDIDTLPAGNDALRTLSQRLQQVLRASDTVARPADGGFTVLLNDIDSVDAARAVAEELVMAVARPGTGEDGEDGAGASVRYGLATFPQDGDDEQALLTHAAPAA
jgi:diguanylate cyclase (GGDEF)-like protein